MQSDQSAHVSLRAHLPGPQAVSRSYKEVTLEGSAKMHSFVDIGKQDSIPWREWSCHRCASCFEGKPPHKISSIEGGSDRVPLTCAIFQSSGAGDGFNSGAEGFESSRVRRAPRLLGSEVATSCDRVGRAGLLRRLWGRFGRNPSGRGAARPLGAPLPLRSPPPFGLDGKRD
eukprot:5902185-Prymnesium_polylepis.2